MPFSYGAGHVQPNQAVDPGLIYNLTSNDYLNFLCALGYNQSQISLFSDEPYQCPKSYSLANFNYPSLTVPDLSGSVTLTRTVTNVGSPGTYKVRVRNPAGVSVSVRPKRLRFSKIGQEKAFYVTLKAKSKGVKDYVFGELLWFDNKQHYVRSPIVVKVKF